MQRVQLSKKLFGPLGHRQAHTGRGAHSATEEARDDYEQRPNSQNMLAGQWKMDGEIEGFKSSVYHVDVNDPEQSARILSYFKSRQPPPPEKRLSFREALRKPREVLKKTKEQVSSFLSSRPDQAEKPHQKPGVPPKLSKSIKHQDKKE